MRNGVGKVGNLIFDQWHLSSWRCCYFESIKVASLFFLGLGAHVLSGRT